MAWRNCEASLALVREINERWPRRDKSSDGTIGDAAHATRSSDHNPWLVVNGQGVVRARDIDKDGIDAGWLAEYLRQLGARGDNRLAGGGYIIWNRRITTSNFSGWKAYTGSNPHTHHVHVSFSRNQAGFDSRAPWGIAGGSAPAPSAPSSGSSSGRPVLRRGSTGQAVRELQSVLARWYPTLNLKVDGSYGPATEQAVRILQDRAGLTADGICGPATYRALGMA